MTTLVQLLVVGRGLSVSVDPASPFPRCGAAACRPVSPLAVDVRCRRLFGRCERQRQRHRETDRATDRQAETDRQTHKGVNQRSKDVTHPQTATSRLRLSLCTLCLYACQVRITVGDSGPCSACVTSFEHRLTPLCIDSTRALWASFSVRFDTDRQTDSQTIYVGGKDPKEKADKEEG